MNTADQLATKYDLTRAKEIMLHKIDNAKEARELLKKEVNQVLSNSTSWDNFKEKAGLKGIDLVETVNKQGAVQGYRIKFAGHDFKASDIDRKITLPNLPHIFKHNVLNMAQEITKSVDRGLGR